MTSTRILVVCHANARRSPAAAALLRAGTGGHSMDGFTIVSAGTEALVGNGMDAAMAAELRTRGLDLPDHRARLLTPREIENADLILTLERAHRSALVRMVPSAVRRTFTLRELAALASGLEPGAVAGHSPAERLASLLDQVPAQRALRLRASASDDDLADLRRPTPHATRVLASDLVAAVQPLIAALGSTDRAEDQAPSAARNSPHHLRSATASAAVQHAKTAR